MTVDVVVDSEEPPRIVLYVHAASQVPSPTLSCALLVFYNPNFYKSGRSINLLALFWHFDAPRGV